VRKGIDKQKGSKVQGTGYMSNGYVEEDLARNEGGKREKGICHLTVAGQITEGERTQKGKFLLGGNRQRGKGCLNYFYSNGCHFKGEGINWGKILRRCRKS